MTPRPSFTNNQANVRAVNAEPLSDNVLPNSRGAQAADFQYLRRVQFRRSNLFAANCASLCRRVGVIIFGRALKEMGRITAQRPVAFMANIQRGPIAFRKKEAKSVGGVATFFPTNADAKTPVATDRFPCPSPAFTLWALAGSLINVTPEACYLFGSKSRRVYINSSHISLLVRSVWLGSFGCFAHSFGPSYFTTRIV